MITIDKPMISFWQQQRQDISETVRRYRGKQTLRQFSAALKAEGITASYQTILNWEHGVYLPDYKHLYRMIQKNNWVGELGHKLLNIVGRSKPGKGMGT